MLHHLADKVNPSEIFKRPKYLQYIIKLENISKALTEFFLYARERTLVEALLDI